MMEKFRFRKKDPTVESNSSNNASSQSSTQTDYNRFRQEYRSQPQSESQLHQRVTQPHHQQLLHSVQQPQGYLPGQHTSDGNGSQIPDSRTPTAPHREQHNLQTFSKEGNSQQITNSYHRNYNQTHLYHSQQQTFNQQHSSQVPDTSYQKQQATLLCRPRHIVEQERQKQLLQDNDPSKFTSRPQPEAARSNHVHYPPQTNDAHDLQQSMHPQTHHHPQNTIRRQQPPEPPPRSIKPQSNFTHDYPHSCGHSQISQGQRPHAHQQSDPYYQQQRHIPHQNPYPSRDLYLLHQNHHHNTNHHLQQQHQQRWFKPQEQGIKHTTSPTQSHNSGEFKTNDDVYERLYLPERSAQYPHNHNQQSNKTTPPHHNKLHVQETHSLPPRENSSRHTNPNPILQNNSATNYLDVRSPNNLSEANHNRAFTNDMNHKPQHLQINQSNLHRDQQFNQHHPQANQHQEREHLQQNGYREQPPRSHESNLPHPSNNPPYNPQSGAPPPYHHTHKLAQHRTQPSQKHNHAIQDQSQNNDVSPRNVNNHYEEQNQTQSLHSHPQINLENLVQQPDDCQSTLHQTQVKPQRQLEPLREMFSDRDEFIKSTAEISERTQVKRIDLQNDQNNLIIDEHKAEERFVYDRENDIQKASQNDSKLENINDHNQPIKGYPFHSEQRKSLHSEQSHQEQSSNKPCNHSGAQNTRVDVETNKQCIKPPYMHADQYLKPRSASVDLETDELNLAENFEELCLQQQHKMDRTPSRGGKDQKLRNAYVHPYSHGEDLETHELKADFESMCLQEQQHRSRKDKTASRGANYDDTGATIQRTSVKDEYNVYPPVAKERKDKQHTNWNGVLNDLFGLDSSHQTATAESTHESTSSGVASDVTSLYPPSSREGERTRGGGGSILHTSCYSGIGSAGSASSDQRSQDSGHPSASVPSSPKGDYVRGISHHTSTVNRRTPVPRATPTNSKHRESDDETPPPLPQRNATTRPLISKSQSEDALCKNLGDSRKAKSSSVISGTIRNPNHGSNSSHSFHHNKAKQFDIDTTAKDINLLADGLSVSPSLHPAKVGLQSQAYCNESMDRNGNAMCGCYHDNKSMPMMCTEPECCGDLAYSCMDSSLPYDPTFYNEICPTSGFTSKTLNKARNNRSGSAKEMSSSNQKLQRQQLALQLNGSRRRSTPSPITPSPTGGFYHNKHAFPPFYDYSDLAQSSSDKRSRHRKQSAHELSKSKRNVAYLNNHTHLQNQKENRHHHTHHDYDYEDQQQRSKRRPRTPRSMKSSSMEELDNTDDSVYMYHRPANHHNHHSHHHYNDNNNHSNSSSPERVYFPHSDRTQTSTPTSQVSSDAITSVNLKTKLNTINNSKPNIYYNKAPATKPTSPVQSSRYENSKSPRSPAHQTSLTPTPDADQTSPTSVVLTSALVHNHQTNNSAQNSSQANTSPHPESPNLNVPQSSRKGSSSPRRDTDTSRAEITPSPCQQCLSNSKSCRNTTVTPASRRAAVLPSRSERRSFNKSCPFESLPNDLILKIFSNLPTDTLCKCAEVCRQWYNIVWDHPALWTSIVINNSNLDIDRALRYLTRRLSYNTPKVCMILEKININGCARLTDRGLTTVVKRCPELRCLDMQGCVGVTNQGVTEAVSRCVNLERLDVTGCPLVSCVSLPETDLSTTAARHLQRIYLRYLDISDCPDVGDNDLLTLSSQCTQLLFLYMRRCAQITDLGVSYVATNCGSLREVSLSDCRHVTDLGMQELSKLGDNLRYLSVAKCEKVSDTGVSHIALRCPKLRYLNVRGCEAVSDHGLEILSRSCLRLRSLDVGKCDVTDAGLYALSSYCPQLRKLGLKSCDGITDRGLVLVAYRCPQLRQLHVQDCSRLTPEAYAMVRKYCRGAFIEHTNPGVL